MGHSTAAATGLVDRLEKLGYVQRLHAQDDRRKVMVQLTKRGHEIMSKYDDAIQAQLKPDTMLNKLCTELFGQPATLAAA
jgi:DNA-binding MarR family transcriptional regulator